MTWQDILRTNVTATSELIDLLELTQSEAEKTLLSHPQFPVNIPRRLVLKMAKRNIHDPIFRQFVPLVEEALSFEGFIDEPVEDQAFKKSSRLLQKYASRALIVTTGACAMNCRFCFRQNYPYSSAPRSSAETLFEEELCYLKNHPEIDEVILSGGDPLSLGDTQFRRLFERIHDLQHIARVRIHTRFPMGIPERINEQILKVLQASPQQVIFVLHTNHLQEFDKDIVKALRSIQAAGIPILSQTVLLRGVNDHVDTLEDLFRFLGNIGVIPYYLHQLDKVRGAHHFEVPIQEGKALIEELQARLSGYLVPRYVQEIPGRSEKTPL